MVNSQRANLLPLHAEHLSAFRISSELLAAAGVQSVSDVRAREMLGLRGHRGDDLSGILFPYRSPVTGEQAGGRIRLNRPLANGGKYISEPECRHLFFPPHVEVFLSDVTVPVVIVEAEKSALSLQSVATSSARLLLPIAIGGCFGWRRKIGVRRLPDGSSEPETGPSPDFDLISWKARTAILAFDSNASTNSSVRRARQLLSLELAARGATVLIAEVPAIEGVNGPDDLVAVSGAAALRVLDTARLFGECAVREANQAVAALEADKKSDPIAAIDAIAAIENVERRILVTGGLVSLRLPGVTRKFIEDQVVCRREKAAAARTAAGEATRRGRLLSMAVKGSELISQLENYFSSRVWQPLNAALVESLFTVLTYCVQHFTTVPYLCFSSATPGCGKSTCVDLSAAVMARPLHSVGLSRAVLVRQLEERRVTLLLDESEWLSGHSESAEAIRGILHAGYRRGAKYQLCEGDQHEIRDFQVFGPKVFSAINGLSGALLDRCIIVQMERMPADETLLPATVDDLEPVAAPLREQLEAFELQVAEQLEALRRDRPPGGYWPEFRNREAELWHPLLTIARLFGPEIERRTLDAARTLCRAKQSIQSDERHIAQGMELVDVLMGMECQRFRPVDVLNSLEQSEAWAETFSEKKDDKTKAAAVGQYLRSFQLKSRSRSRSGSSYSRTEVIEVVGRHLPVTHSEKSATSVTSATSSEKTDGCVVADPEVEIVTNLEESRRGASALEDAIATQSSSSPRMGAIGTHATRDKVADVAVHLSHEEDL